MTIISFDEPGTDLLEAEYLSKCICRRDNPFLEDGKCDCFELFVDPTLLGSEFYSALDIDLFGEIETVFLEDSVTKPVKLFGEFVEVLVANNLIEGVSANRSSPDLTVPCLEREERAKSEKVRAQILALREEIHRGFGDG